MNKNPNKEKARKLMRVIIEFSIAHNGRFPTTKEFANAAGFKSQSVSFYWYRALEELGYLGMQKDGDAQGHFYVIGSHWSPPSWYMKMDNAE